MMFWGLAGLMTLVAVALLLRPLLKPPSAAVQGSLEAGAARNLAVYRDQLQEVERDLARGVIDQDQAEGARLEIKRRILGASASTAGAASAAGGDMADGADGAEQGAPSGTGRVGATRLVATAVVVLVPALALGAYYVMGNPGLPGMPYAERPSEVNFAGQENQAAMISRVEAHLEATPNDEGAWVVLGHLYRRALRYDDAIGAYRRALVLAPNWEEAEVAVAETLVGKNQGNVTVEARRLFAKVLQNDPHNPSALYYAGLALAQDGLLKDALSVWTSLLRASPKESPWIPLVTRQAQNAAIALGLDPATLELGPGMADDAFPSVVQRQPGPSADDIAAAESMTDEERGAFIQSMVDRLAGRLEEDPDDLQGWLRLANAYSVLNQPDKARAALDSAEKLVADLPEDHNDRRAVESAVRALSAKN